MYIYIIYCKELIYAITETRKSQDVQGKQVGEERDDGKVSVHVSIGLRLRN